MKQVALVLAGLMSVIALRSQSTGTAAQQRAMYSQYGLLTTALQEMRRIQQQGGWTAIPSNARSLQLGDTGRSVQALAEQLLISGDATVSSALFDEQLEKAVKRFQYRHGLKQDGIVGPATRQALNVSIEERIRQVSINIQRTAWMPYDSTQLYIVVNIPAFQLQVMQGKHELFPCKVVVGKSTHRTAEFRGWLRHVIFSPYWNIPDNIYNKEIAPILQKDPGYLERNHMEWKDGALRQRPGPDNALGGVAGFASPWLPGKKGG